MATKQHPSALITDLEKIIATVELALAKARNKQRVEAEKKVTTAQKLLDKGLKKLESLLNKAPKLPATKKTSAQIERQKKWKASVTEQKQEVAHLKASLQLVKEVGLKIKQNDKTRALIEKEKAMALKKLVKPKAKTSVKAKASITPAKKAPAAKTKAPSTKKAVQTAPKKVSNIGTKKPTNTPKSANTANKVTPKKTSAKKAPTKKSPVKKAANIKKDKVEATRSKPASSATQNNAPLDFKTDKTIKPEAIVQEKATESSVVSQLPGSVTSNPKPIIPEAKSEPKDSQIQEETSPSVQITLEESIQETRQSEEITADDSEKKAPVNPFVDVNAPKKAD